MTNLTKYERQVKVSFEQVNHWQDARARWVEYRQLAGRKGYTPLLTPPKGNTKTAKNAIPTYLLHLAPCNLAGKGTVCPWASPGCRAACLNTAGRGRFEGTQDGRTLKTAFFADNPAAFYGNIYHEVDLALGRHGSSTKRHPSGLFKWANLGIRLNGTSDIRWELVAPWLFDIFPSVQFYDYTKAISRETPDNYALTYSASERDSEETIRARALSFGRATVVFDTPAGKYEGRYTHNLPISFAGLPVADGDLDDWRLEDGPVIIGLRAKGDAIGDTSGFVRSAS